MFDLSNPDTRNKKMRLIEVLLIFGGMVGGFKIEKKDALLPVFGMFLIAAMMYYFMLSRAVPGTRYLNHLVAVISVFVSAGFSAMTVLPLFPSITFLQGTSGIFWALLTLLIFVNLYQ